MLDKDKMTLFRKGVFPIFFSKCTVLSRRQVVDSRLFSSMSAFSLTFLTCGCDAEKICSPSGDAQCACPLEEVSAASRRGATRRSGRRDSKPTLQATIPSLLVSFHCQPPAENGPFLLIFFLPAAKGVQYVWDLTSPEKKRNIRIP